MAMHDYDEIMENQNKLGTPIQRMGFTKKINKDVLNYIKNSNKEVMFVAKWQITKGSNIDAKKQASLEKKGLHNLVVIADALIEGRYTPASELVYVKSGYLKSMHLDCIFETQNTCYVLCNIQK